MNQPHPDETKDLNFRAADRIEVTLLWTIGVAVARTPELLAAA